MSSRPLPFCSPVHSAPLNASVASIRIETELKADLVLLPFSFASVCLPVTIRRRDSRIL